MALRDLGLVSSLSWTSSRRLTMGPVSMLNTEKIFLMLTGFISSGCSRLKISMPP